MTNDDLKARLRYTVEHGLIAAAKTDMAASYAESLEAIERLEAEVAKMREALKKIAALEDDFESNAAMTAHEWQVFHTARAALEKHHD